MNLPKNSLSERLKELRAEQNISQYTLSENLGLSRGLMSNYEQGRREPDYNTLLLISNYFDVSLDYILGVTDIKKRLLHESTSDKYKNLMVTISNLSKESVNELEKYIELLKMRDEKISKKESQKSS